MKMSVMFITFNRKKELLRAVESCVKNRIEKMEIIIVDNHSEDGTQADAERLLMENKMPYKYYYASENLGISVGRNLAFSLCEGEYVFCLDDDAVIQTEDFFDRIYNKMTAVKDAIAAAVEIYEPETGCFLKGLVYEKKGVSYAHSYIGAAHILKREVFAGKKLYPEKLTFGSEEAYIAYRIWGMRKRMLYLDNVRVLHLPSKIARVYGNERKLNIIINNHIIRKLCYPKILSPILYLNFRTRLWRHKLLNDCSYDEVKKIIRGRYDKTEEDRMSIGAFLNMLRDVGVKWTL
jgi:glycosyltransferase involved in cell wall biosynthesis